MRIGIEEFTPGGERRMGFTLDKNIWSGVYEVYSFLEEDKELKKELGLDKVKPIPHPKRFLEVAPPILEKAVEKFDILEIDEWGEDGFKKAVVYGGKVYQIPQSNALIETPKEALLLALVYSGKPIPPELERDAKMIVLTQNKEVIEGTLRLPEIVKGLSLEVEEYKPAKVDLEGIKEEFTKDLKGRIEKFLREDLLPKDGWVGVDAERFCKRLYPEYAKEEDITLAKYAIDYEKYGVDEMAEKLFECCREIIKDDLSKMIEVEVLTPLEQKIPLAKRIIEETVDEAIRDKEFMKNLAGGIYVYASLYKGILKDAIEKHERAKRFLNL